MSFPSTDVYFNANFGFATDSVFFESQKTIYGGTPSVANGFLLLESPTSYFLLLEDPSSDLLLLATS